MASVIKTEALTKWYGSVRAVDGLDLEVKEGEIFGFLGPNGAGKTTTIRILTGFLRPSRGRATVLGLDSWSDSTRIKARIGFLPDAPSLYGNVTGEEFLDYLIRLQGGAAPVLRRDLCDRLELGQADLARRIKGYSRGMVQKLAIVQAIQHDPELLIMDEPTGGLDPLVQLALFELLLELQSRGRTVFLSSHILTEVERLCRRVGIIRDGTMAAVEEVEVLRKRTPRRLEVVLAEDIPEDGLGIDGVVSVDRDGRRVRMMVSGDVKDILRELARWDVVDVVFERPHLEDVFLDFYRTGESNE